MKTYKRYNPLSYTISQPRDRMVKRKSLVGCDQESAIHNDATSVTEWYLPNSGKARPILRGVSRVGRLVTDGDEGVGVEGFGRHHFLPSSALNSCLPYDEINSVGAQNLSWEREYGQHTNLPPAK